MEASATLKSAQDGTTLELFGRLGDNFLARLAGPNLEATATVYDHEPADLKHFFADLAANWKGWRGQKQWKSLEGELQLDATIDSTGHVKLSVQMRSGPYPFDWRLSAALLLEAGQLDRIAHTVASFLDDGDDSTGNALSRGIW